MSDRSPILWSFGLRFHVGVPLRTTDGFNLGTLCVIDREPRPISERQNAQFEDLASVVMDQMELRLSARRAVSELSQVIVENQAALQRSDMMKKEIDHRVMNSLQLTSSLLAFVSILARRLKRLASDEVGAWRLRTASETRCEWIVLSNLYRKTCNEH